MFSVSLDKNSKFLRGFQKSEYPEFSRFSEAKKVTPQSTLFTFAKSLKKNIKFAKLDKFFLTHFY